jgi:succinyl-diaminopimelate desuccinylase
MDPVERTVWLCAQPSVTRGERHLADALEASYRDAGETVARVGDSLVVGVPDGRPLVALVGHIDTVPATPDDRDPRVEDRAGGPGVVGRGTSDMKSGVAVAEALFADPAVREGSPYSLVLARYAREEGPAEENELGRVLVDVAWLADAALAVVLEPTDLEVQLGCTGSLQAVLTVTGRQAHSARPWTGESALTRALPLLEEIASYEPVEVRVDGIPYRDVLSTTQIWTDNPKNVVPGSVWINVNLRFAPSRGLDEAEKEIHDRFEGRAEVEIVDRAPPAPPFLGQEIVDRFVNTVEATTSGKQGWTDVARFASIGVPALNYGPGATAQAHQAGEHVPVASILEAERKVRAFLLPGSL